MNARRFTRRNAVASAGLPIGCTYLETRQVAHNNEPILLNSNSFTSTGGNFIRR